MYWINYFVNDYRPTIFINFETPQAKVAFFSAAVLPVGFEMVKLKILESDSPAYCLTLNTYIALRRIASAHTEWSVFVKDPTKEKPRSMVFQTLSSTLSLDTSVEAITTMPEPSTYVHDNGKLVYEVQQGLNDSSVHYFSSSIVWTQDSAQTDGTTPEFVAANDVIYWGGSVCDHGLSSGSMHNRDVTVIPTGDYTVIDDTQFDKTKILENDVQGEYYLMLSVFDTNDVIEGTRAEWSADVDDGNGREHFMAIELMTEDAVLDPVSLLNLPSVVEYDLSGDMPSTTLASSTIKFSAALDVTEGSEVLLLRGWVEAKDFVCYLNGICDK